MSSLKESVTSLVTWISEYRLESLESLNPGVNEIALNEFEKTFDISLPAEVRELYQIYDGQDESGPLPMFFGGYRFLPLYSLTKEFEAMEDREAYAHVDFDAGVKQMTTNALWLPIASDDNGNYLGVDLDPAIGGIRGQIIRFGCDESHVRCLAKSLTDYFARAIADGFSDYEFDEE